MRFLCEGIIVSRSTAVSCVAWSATASSISKWYVLVRSGLRANPSPLVVLACGSQSTSSTGTSAAAKDAAKLMAVVVLPTPPFWLATAMIFAMSCAAETDGRVAEWAVQRQGQILVQFTKCSTRNIFSVQIVPRGTLWKTRKLDVL